MMRHPASLLLFLLSLISIAIRVSPQAVNPPIGLRVEYLEPSLAKGIDVVSPRFSYLLTSPSERGFVQSAYQILVSTNSSVSSGDVWDSGMVKSAQTSQISFAGSALKSDTSYWWKVRVYDANGHVSPYSEVAQFDTGLFHSSDWTGKWIGGYNMLRHTFSLSSPAKRARAFITGLGYYELYVNGVRVGDRKLDIGWTDYRVRVLYSTYDVTEYLKSGENAVGIMIGNGWWGQGLKESPRARLQLNIQTSSGITQVVTDTNWKGIAGPITSDSVYNGETYDARKEQKGWSEPNFDDSKWSAVSELDTNPKYTSAQLMPPIRDVRALSPVSRTEPEKGVYVFDFGINHSGWVELSVKGNSGQSIALRHAELLQHNNSGMIYTANLRSAKATDTYTLKGEGVEVYQPRFTYHGFRFLEVRGYPGEPSLSSVKAHHVFSDVDRVGSITFGHPVLDRVHSNIIYGQESNLMSVPTDCDQRDERLGWMGDGQLSADEAIFNFDMASFYSNWLNLMRDDQGPQGEIADVVPSFRYGHQAGDPAWGAAYPLISYYLWKHYGDEHIIANHYDSIKAWIEYLRANATTNGIKRLYCWYGDWVPPPPAKRASCHFTAGFYFILNTRQLAEMAKMLGKTTDAQEYEKLAETTGKEFNQAWFVDGKYGIGVQTTMALPLYLGIVEDAARLEKDLLNDIQSHGTTLTTGIIGTKYLPLVLTNMGRTDVALQIASTTDYPSWGWEFTQTIEARATTLFELWDSPKEGPGMNSRNHIMFGSIGNWYYTVLAGIQQEKNSVGFSNIVIQPPDSNILLNSALTTVSAATTTHAGTIQSGWGRSGGERCFEGAYDDILNVGCGERGGVITDVLFASYGFPSGTCATGYTTSDCHDPLSEERVRKECVGKSECNIHVDGNLNCIDTRRRMFVKVICSAPPSFSVNVLIPPNAKASVHVNELHLSNVTITEGSRTVWKEGKFQAGDPGVVSASEANNEVTFSVGSGEYHFVVTGTEGEKLIAKAIEGEEVNLKCENFDRIKWLKSVSYLTESNTICPKIGSARHVLEKECVGKGVCSLFITDQKFGEECEGKNRLVVEYYCG